MGSRFAVYDAQRNVVWVLTWALSGGGMSLTSYDPRRDTAETFPLRVKSDGYVGAGIDLDAGGNVWAAWGDQLVRFSPDTHRITSWPLPATRFDPDNAEVGRVVAAAVTRDGTVLVARGEERDLVQFDPRSESWRGSAALPVVPNGLSRFARAADGSLYLTGAVDPKGPVEAMHALARVTASADAAQLVAQDAIAAVPRPDGTVAILRTDGQTVVMRPPSDTPQAGATAIADIPFNAPLAADPQGRLWIWREARDGVFVARIDPESQTVEQLAFPVRRYPGGGPPAVHPGLPPVDVTGWVIPPVLQQLVIGQTGTVFALTLSGADPVNPAPYASIYRITGYG